VAARSQATNHCGRSPGLTSQASRKVRNAALLDGIWSLAASRSPRVDAAVARVGALAQLIDVALRGEQLDQLVRRALVAAVGALTQFVDVALPGRGA